MDFQNPQQNQDLKQHIEQVNNEIQAVINNIDHVIKGKRTAYIRS